jgi:hypothetical protein
VGRFDALCNVNATVVVAITAAATITIIIGSPSQHR